MLEPLDTQNPRNMGIQNPQGRQFLDSQEIPTSFCAPELSVFITCAGPQYGITREDVVLNRILGEGFLGRSMKVSTQIM